MKIVFSYKDFFYSFLFKIPAKQNDFSLFFRFFSFCFLQIKQNPLCIEDDQKRALLRDFWMEKQGDLLSGGNQGSSESDVGGK